MAKIGVDINDSQAKDFKAGNEVVAPGWYNAVIIESVIYDNSKNTGKLLTLTYELISSGSKVKDRLNLTNSSEVAQKIGQATLSKIKECVGHKGKLEDTDYLHGKPFAIKLIIDEFKGSDNNMVPINKVKDYKPKLTTGSSSVETNSVVSDSGNDAQQKTVGW